MGKMLIFLVIGMGFIVSYSAMQLNRSTLNATDNASGDFEINQARNLAVSGVEYAMMELATDTSWSEGYKSSISHGTLSVHVERTRAMYPGGPDAGLNNARLVTSTGTVQGMSVTVESIVEIPSAYVRPPGLAYGIFSDKSMDLSGNISVGTYNKPHLNANVHTNQDLTYGGSSSVTGYGTFSENCPSGSSTAGTVFKPNTPTGEELVSKAPPVPIPEIDPSKWESFATRKFYSNTTVNGSIKLGTIDRPEIIFVRGDLHLNGQMQGYGAFLVTGDITINGGAEVTDLNPSGNNLGIIAGGNAKINGTSDIMATLLVKGDAKINGNTKIIGSVIADGEISFGGSAEILYNPLVDPVARKIWEGEPARPRIVSFYE